MKTQFARTVLCSWLLVCLCCAFGINGRGGGDGDEEETEEFSVDFVSASPAPGSTLEHDATILVTFNGTPTGVNVNVRQAKVTGNTVTSFTGVAITIPLGKRITQ